MLGKERGRTVGQDRGQVTEAGKGKIGDMVTVKFG